jgi:hypothetical protein
MPANRLRCQSGASGQSWVFGGGSADQAWDSTAGMRAGCGPAGCADGPSLAALKKRLIPSSACGCDRMGAAGLAGAGDGGSSAPDEGAASGLDEA